MLIAVIRDSCDQNKMFSNRLAYKWVKHTCEYIN